MHKIFRTPSLWREMDRLQRDMNRLFTQYSPSRLQVAPSYPALDVWVNENGQYVSAEMPGIQAKDIDIRIDRDVLTITGERGADDIPDDVVFHRRERGFGKFSRTVQLPFAVDADRVEASFKNGILNIALPKTEVEKPKQIAIKS